MSPHVAGRTPVLDRPRLAIYQNRSIRSVAAVTARRRQECLALVTELGGSIDPVADVYVDNVSAGERSATGFHREMERLLVAVGSGRYDGVVVWQIPWQFTSVEVRASFQRVMVGSACELYVVRNPQVSLFGPMGLLFAL